jgi:hypothetical protein
MLEMLPCRFGSALKRAGIGFDLSGSYDGVGHQGDDAVTDKALLRVPMN